MIVIVIAPRLTCDWSGEEVLLLLVVGGVWCSMMLSSFMAAILFYRGESSFFVLCRMPKDSFMCPLAEGVDRIGRMFW